MASISADSIGYSSRRLFVGVALLVFTLLLGRNLTRELDSDEHQFIAPLILTQRDHLLPYRDFPSNHLPTQICLYALLTGWTSYKLLAVRVVATICSTATLLLLFGAGWRLLAGKRRGERWLVVGGLLVVLATCRFFTYTSGLGWNHDTAILCCLGAYFLFLHGLQTDGLTWIAVAGLLIGTAVGIRLSFIFTFVPFVPVLLLCPAPLTTRRRLTGLTLATLAALVALTPTFELWKLAPVRFIFGNVQYSQLYMLSDGIHGTFLQNLLAKLGRAAWRFGNDPGNLFLLISFFVSVIGLVRRRAVWWGTERGPALLLLGGLLIAVLIGVMGPTPQQYQYNYALLPFMLLVVFHALALEEVDGASWRRWRIGVAAAALLLGTVGLARWYRGIVDLPFPERWAVVREHRRGEWLRSYAPQDGRVLTVAPIAPLEGGLHIYPEHNVGYFTLRVAAFQTAEERKCFGTVAVEDLETVLAEQPPDLVYCPPRSGFEDALAGYAEAHGYHQVEERDKGYRLWVRPTVSQTRTNN